MRALLMALALGACTSMTPVAEAYEPLPLDGFEDAIHRWRNRLGDDYASYAPDQVREIADNILLLQRDHGGWIENRDPTRILSADDVSQLEAEKRDAAFSFDNRNIYSQIEYLMGAYERTGDARFRDGAERGLALVLNEQTPDCGAWRHSSPPRNDYHARITIADEVTSGNLRLLRRVVARAFPFARVDHALRQRASTGLARGDQCLLTLQIRQNGRLTGWAGQYDPDTLQPAGGRRFELPAIVSQETVEVVRYLMSIPEPTPEQIAAIEAAVAWLRDSQLRGLRLVETQLDPPVRYEHHTATIDRALVPDLAAPPLWARFYDLNDNSVVLANRDGVRAASYADVHPERRSGYSWYGTWPRTLLERDYPTWRARIGR